ncbi:Ribonuclease H-like domain,Integrase, catalytic core [Cinara cedri]|uniref:Ribonuclease H-like domain,Integrase, catalytic core n=1 Tax=Cinara cedri TaxID=506608 RepID=A0A5E4MNH2_9HEMI|nr:Ribonuclease H-like domain,Integrase, catalytic core [Cinara cedri]
MAIHGRDPKTTNELITILTEIESTSLCENVRSKPLIIPVSTDTFPPGARNNNHNNQHYVSNNPRTKPIHSFQDNQNHDSYTGINNFRRPILLDLCDYPIKKATALIVTNRMIDQFVKVHGKPTTIVSDHGVQFISHIWQSRLTESDIQVSTTSVYHPQSNPSEKVIRELGRLPYILS